LTASRLQCMVWQTNPTKLALLVISFCPPRMMWPDLFAKMMKDKVGKKKK